MSRAAATAWAISAWAVACRRRQRYALRGGDKSAQTPIASSADSASAPVRASQPPPSIELLRPQPILTRYRRDVRSGGKRLSDDPPFALVRSHPPSADPGDHLQPADADNHSHAIPSEDSPEVRPILQHSRNRDARRQPRGVCIFCAYLT